METEIFLSASARSWWFGLTVVFAAIGGFFWYMLLTVPTISAQNLTPIDGVVTTYRENRYQNLVIQLAGHARTFEISDMEYLDRAAFEREIHANSPVRLLVLTSALQSPRNSLVVFELRSGSTVYLPLQPLLDSRRNWDHVIIP